MNILLVDSTVEDYQLFVDSANNNTKTIVYSPNTTREELFSKMNIAQRIAVVSHTTTNIEGEPLFSDTNVDFFKNIIETYQIKQIDYLACNTLNNQEWVDYFKKLPCIIGASNDATGNLKYGGDWIMESTAEDIEFVYFTQSIEYYKYLLAPLNFTTTINNGTLTAVSPTNLSIYDLSSFSITKIAASVFQNSNTLSNITFPTNLSTIESGAFSDCPLFKVLNLSGKKISSISGVLNGSSIQVINLGNTMYLNDIGTFTNNTNLTRVNLFGSALKSIADYAFSGCTMLNNVILPLYLTSIGTHAFDGCSSLKVICGSSDSIITTDLICPTSAFICTMDSSSALTSVIQTNLTTYDLTLLPINSIAANVFYNFPNLKLKKTANKKNT